MDAPFRLRDLGAGARLALTLLLLVNLAGFVASGLHMQSHHENRDERPGLSYDDLQGAYHGVRSQAGLIRALEGGHPGEIEGHNALPDAQKKLLLSWLSGKRITEDYDNLDLGDNAPAEIIASNCLQCHSRKSEDAIGKKIPLEYWDDVKAVAFSREISPTDTKILLASTHTHAISLASITLVIVFMMLLTAWPSWLRSSLSLIAALGLSADLAAWWLARSMPAFVNLIIAGGIAYAVSVGAMTLAILVDLWRPRRS